MRGEEHDMMENIRLYAKRAFASQSERAKLAAELLHYIQQETPAPDNISPARWRAMVNSVIVRGVPSSNYVNCAD